MDVQFFIFSPAAQIIKNSKNLEIIFSSKKVQLGFIVLQTITLNQNIFKLKRFTIVKICYIMLVDIIKKKPKTSLTYLFPPSFTPCISIYLFFIASDLTLPQITWKSPTFQLTPYLFQNICEFYYC